MPETIAKNPAGAEEPKQQPKEKPELPQDAFPGEDLGKVTPNIEAMKRIQQEGEAKQAEAEAIRAAIQAQGTEDIEPEPKVPTHMSEASLIKLKELQKKLEGSPYRAEAGFGKTGFEISITTGVGEQIYDEKLLPESAQTAYQELLTSLQEDAKKAGFSAAGVEAATQRGIAEKKQKAQGFWGKVKKWFGLGR